MLKSQHWIIDSPPKKRKNDENLEDMLNQFEDTVEDIKPIKLPTKKKSLGTLLDQLENDTHKCYYCGKEFIKRSFLQLHRKKHIDKGVVFRDQ